MKSRLLFAAVLATGTSFSAWTYAAEKAPVPGKSTPVVTKSTNVPRTLPSIDFQGASFTDCISYLAETTGANLIVNWKTLEAAGVKPDTPITIKLNTISFRKALELVLAQAGGETKLTWIVDEGVMEITTQAAEDARLVTRVYPIQDLLFEAPDFTNAPQANLQNTGSAGRRGGNGGGGGGGGSGQNSGIFSGTGNGGNSSTDSSKSGLTQKEKAEEIISMIKTTIRPEVWDDNGGTSKIVFSRGRLIITAPLSVHRLIG